jgi:hypothetical protein
MKQELVSGAAGGGKTKVDVIDDSSWSCAHALGRWKGTCCCDEPSPQALEFKSYLYNTLQDMNNRVNGQLDAVIPGWRKDFASLFVELSDDILPVRISDLRFCRPWSRREEMWSWQNCILPKSRSWLV